MSTIRSLLIDGHSYNDIQTQLGGTISERTFWRYVKKIFASDIRNLERTTNEQAMRQISIHLERANNIYRKLDALASDNSIKAECRIEALRDMFKLSRGLIETHANAPAAAINMKKKLAELSAVEKSIRQHQQQHQQYREEQWGGQTYRFPINQIFDPSNRNPYVEGNSILTPEETSLRETGSTFKPDELEP
jgi:hypothetical protein